MTQEERTRITEKIRKVLALASDPSITEGEQNNYRRRARSLMETFCIAHIEDPSTSEGVIEVKFQPNGILITRSLFEVLPLVLEPIARYFGCFTIIRRKDDIRFEEFVGYRPNIEIVQYTVDVVLRQGSKEYRSLYRSNRSITLGYSYWLGFAAGIRDKFKLDSEPEGKGLVIYNKVKEHLDRITGGKTAKIGYGMVNADHYKSGKTVGENVVVHTGIGTSSNKGNL